MEFESQTSSGDSHGLEGKLGTSASSVMDLMS